MFLFVITINTYSQIFYVALARCGKTLPRNFDVFSSGEKPSKLNLNFTHFLTAGPLIT